MGFTALNVKKSISSSISASTEPSSSSSSPTSRTGEDPHNLSPPPSTSLDQQQDMLANSSSPQTNSKLPLVQPSLSTRSSKSTHTQNTSRADPFIKPMTPSSAAVFLNAKHKTQKGYPSIPDTSILESTLPASKQSSSIPPSSSLSSSSSSPSSSSPQITSSAPKPATRPYNRTHKPALKTIGEKAKPTPFASDNNTDNPPSEPVTTLTPGSDNKSTNSTPIQFQFKTGKRKYERRAPQKKTNSSPNSTTAPTTTNEKPQRRRSSSSFMTSNPKQNSQSTKDASAGINTQTGSQQQQAIHTHYLYPQIRSRANPPLDLTDVIKPNDYAEPLPRTNRAFDIEDAPTFSPSYSEFSDPLAYIDKISSIGKKYGMVKIIPPPNWRADFSLDTEMFWFKARRQHLNSELGGFLSRIHFISNLHYFHKMNGTAIGKIPMIDKRTLDLYHLHMCVRLRGGFVTVCRKKMWAQIGRELGYNGKIMTSLSTSLKSSYQKFVAPYDDFLKQANIVPSIQNGRDDSDLTNNGVFVENFLILNQDYDMNNYAAVMNVLPGEMPDYPENTMQFVKDYQQMVHEKMFSDNGRKTGAIQKYEFPNGGILKFFVFYRDQPSDFFGSNFGRDPKKDAVKITEFYKHDLKTNGLGNSPTVTCSHTPIIRYNNVTWNEIKQPSASNDKLCEVLEDSDISSTDCPTYNLRQFQRKADKFYDVYFKHKFFQKSLANMSPSEETVENEYWKNLSDSNTLEVEYGIDIHTSIHGSPFPQPERDASNPNVLNPWNLNALPFNKNSLLRFVDIPSLSLVQPWLQIGMLFSSKSWNHSDIFSHSVSYNHFGASRTWYCVPEEDHEKMRRLLASVAGPNTAITGPTFLFEFNRMVTPETLKANGIRCYAIEQRPGQFLVNFPKSYSCHFNHGFNLFESVQTLPIRHWIPYGLEAFHQFSKYRLRPPFCLEKMMLIALQDKNEDITARILPTLCKLIEEEIKLRKSLIESFPQIYIAAENHDLNDFAYVSTVSNQYCYFSRVVNAKKQSVLTINEFFDLDSSTNISDYTFVIRIPDRHLESILHQKSINSESVDNWKEKYHAHLRESPKPDLEYLRDLLFEGKQFFVSVSEVPGLEKFVMKADQWVNKAQMVLRDFEVTPQSHPKTTTKFDPFERIEFLERLANELPDIPFHSPETEQVRYWASKVQEFLDSLEKSIRGNASEDYQHDLLAHATQLGLPISNLDRMMKIKKWTDLVSDAQKHSSDEKILSTIQYLYQQGLELQIPLPLPAALAASIPIDKLEEEEQKNHAQQKLSAFEMDNQEKPKNLQPGFVENVTQLEREHSPAVELESPSLTSSALSTKPNAPPPKKQSLSPYNTPIVGDINEDLPPSKVLDIIEKRCKSSSIHNRPSYGEVNRIIENIKGDANEFLLNRVIRLVQRVEDWYSEGKRLFQTKSPMSILLPALQWYCANSFNLQDKIGPSDSSEKRACLCRTPPSKFGMVQCIICHESFHVKCLGSRKYITPIESGEHKDKFVCPVCQRVEEFSEGSEDTNPKFGNLYISSVVLIHSDLSRPSSDEFANWARQKNRLPLQPDEFCSLSTTLQYIERYQKYLHDEIFIGIDSGTVSLDEARLHLRKVEGGIILLESERAILAAAIERLSEKKDYDSADSLSNAPPADVSVHQVDDTFETQHSVGTAVKNVIVRGRSNSTETRHDISSSPNSQSGPKSSNGNGIVILQEESESPEEAVSQKNTTSNSEKSSEPNDEMQKPAKYSTKHSGTNMKDLNVSSTQDESHRLRSLSLGEDDTPFVPIIVQRRKIPQEMSESSGDSVCPTPFQKSPPTNEAESEYVLKPEAKLKVEHVNSFVNRVKDEFLMENSYEPESPVIKEGDFDLGDNPEDSEVDYEDDFEGDDEEVRGDVKVKAASFQEKDWRPNTQSKQEYEDEYEKAHDYEQTRNRSKDRSEKNEHKEQEQGKAVISKVSKESAISLNGQSPIPLTINSYEPSVATTPRKRIRPDSNEPTLGDEDDIGDRTKKMRVTAPAL